MASHNKLSETRMASMSSLNQELEVGGQGVPPSGVISGLNAQGLGSNLDNSSPAGVVPGMAGPDDPNDPSLAARRTISQRGEEARGGFVLRAKSDDMPQRRRSLVERSGMKTLVQVSVLIGQTFAFARTPRDIGVLHKKYASCLSRLLV